MGEELLAAAADAAGDVPPPPIMSQPASMSGTPTTALRSARVIFVISSSGMD
jgi:hypothetical protein